jgi:hypothetical protein
MKIENLLEEKLSESIKSIRVSNENYEELVFLNKNGTSLHEDLTKKLGPVINNKSVGSPQKATEIIETAIETANSNGGIDDDQFLYGGMYNSFKVVIMIWPWQDNEHITIKKFIL